MVVQIRTLVASRNWLEAGGTGTFWDDGNVLYFGWGDGHEGVCIYQNSSNCTINNLCILLYVRDSLNQKQKKIIPHYRSPLEFFEAVWLMGRLCWKAKNGISPSRTNSFFHHECQPPIRGQPHWNELISASRSVGLWAVDSSSLSQHSVPFLIFREVLFQNLAQTLSSPWDSFFHLFFRFWSIALFLCPSPFKVSNQRAAEAVLGTEPTVPALSHQSQRDIPFFSRGWICTDCGSTRVSQVDIRAVGGKG